MKSWLKYSIIIFTLLAAGAAGLATSFYFFEQDSKNVTAIKAPDAGSKDATVIETFHYPAAFSKALKHDPHAGKKVFHAYCRSCHIDNAIIPLNAPRIGHKEDWVNRRKIGIDALLKLTTVGYGRMPARGGCFECTDNQIKQAIQYILDNSQ